MILKVTKWANFDETKITGISRLFITAFPRLWFGSYIVRKINYFKRSDTEVLRK